MLTAAQLLAIPETVPERLFSAPETVEIEYKALARRMHPDTGGNVAAFQHLGALHALAKRKVLAGEWQVPGRLDLTGNDGKIFRLRFLREFDAGIGRAYIGSTLVSFVLAPDLADLAANATARINGLTYPSERIRLGDGKIKGIESRLPKVHKSFATASQRVVILQKPASAIRLRDILDHFGGKIAATHVAWIVNRLYDLACYLQWAKLSHNDISLDTVYVDPAAHSVHLTGGWWYAASVGERMQRLQTARTVRYAPQAVLHGKIASALTDLTLIRLLGREMLGDATGAALANDTTLPGPMLAWLRHASAGDAREDYRRWGEVLKASFGERRFVEMAVTSSDIYKE